MDKGVLAIAALAGLAGGTGVVLAGLAAHGMPDPLLETGARLLMIHAAAALAAAALASTLERRRGFFLAAAVLVLLGSFLFCADLATRAIGGSRLFPMAAPIGGTLTILGWACLTLAALRAMVGKP